MESNKVGLIVLILIICLCCIGICCVVSAGAALFGIGEMNGFNNLDIDNYESEYTADAIETEVAPVMTEDDPISPDVYAELDNLSTVLISKQDAREIAERLQGIKDIPEVVATSAEPIALGAQSDFWVTNTDNNVSRQITASLAYATDHVYFWVDNEVEYDQADLEKLVDTFENEIYPTNHEFFGTEWTPGIDGDEHVYILYSRDLGSSLAGYFSSSDSVNPLASKYSNAHEMFLMNSDTVALWEDYIYGVLAHEFQHMIHWNLDSNEESWMNEGFSELATLLNGYDPGGFDTLYLSDTDLQLNDWPADSTMTSPHYGASFLFFTYFLDRFGEEITQEIVRNQENGFESIDQTFESAGLEDEQTGEIITSDDVFVDWTLANYFNDSAIDDGRYVYTSYDLPYTTQASTFNSECGTNWQNSAVRQYGVDMIELDCSGQQTLEFDGSNIVKVIPQDAYSGSYAFWSNKGDDSDMTITRMFDLSDVSGPVEMSYYTWYDIEEDYDYVYALTSTDGEQWEFVHTDQGTDSDPTGANLGWGYNGASDAWVKETIDLSAFAGQKVYVRFEYVTDAAVNAEGFLLDDVSVPAIDYFEDFEKDDGGWSTDGFVRIENKLPQTFRVTVVNEQDHTVIDKFSVLPGENLSIDLDFDQEGPILLFVSGTTRYTRQVAVYQYKFQ
jgi:immune inhibitor A